MPGSSDELMHVFFARGLQQREQSLDVGEMIYEVRCFSGEALAMMIARGQIRDAKTLIGLFYALGFQNLLGQRLPGQNFNERPGNA
jgi:ADP-ribose pyrophosphatase